jgi:hypothetical protein
MSTRAIYTFLDGVKQHNVYVHHDGYAAGAAIKIRRATQLAWPLLRFEADEFAAAFVAANKARPGDVRLLKSGGAKNVAPDDIEFRYEIFTKGGALMVRAFATNYWGDEKREGLLFLGPFGEFEAWAERDAAA